MSKHIITIEEFNNAIETSKNKKEASKKLNISLRTFFRLQNKFLKNKPKTEEELRKLLLEKKEKEKQERINNKINKKTTESIVDDVFKMFPNQIKQNNIQRDEYLDVKSKTKDKNTCIKKINKSIYNSSINHFVISDLQIGLNTPTDHLLPIAKEIIERKPNVIVFLGDVADITCLYNIVKDNFDSKAYKQEIKVFNEKFSILMNPIIEEIKKSDWNPRIVLCLGNHEERILRFVNNYKSYAGFMGIDDLLFSEYNIEVIPFLEPIIIDGIAYCHYFTTGLMNKPVASTKQLLNRKLMNCVMGHKQSFEIHREVRADGQPIFAIFAGSSYIHDEEYLGPQGNHYSRLVWSLNNVDSNNFDPEMLLLSRLINKWK